MNNDQLQSGTIRAGHVFKTKVYGDSIREIEQTAMSQARECLGENASLEIQSSFTVSPNPTAEYDTMAKKYLATVYVYETLLIPDN